MSREKRFSFAFDVSNEFLRREPRVAAQYLDIAKAEIAAREYVVGPRGGNYRLISPPLEWRSGQNEYGFVRDITTYMTRRVGRYVRPDRVRAVGPDAPTFATLSVEVKDGEAILPRGQKVQTDCRYVAFPVLVNPLDV